MNINLDNKPEQVIEVGVTYKWIDSTITIPIETYNSLYNSLSSIVSSPLFQGMAQQLNTIAQAHATLNKILEVGVKEGYAVPAPSSADSNTPASAINASQTQGN